MIQKEQIKQLVEEFVEQSDYALQTLEIDKDNNILVEIDRLGVVDLEYCAELNRFLVEQIDTKIKPKEDYSLEVGSVSLTAPFVSKIQYEKHVGHEVEVLTNGKKIHGVLVSVDVDTFQIDVEEMVHVEGKKRRQKQVVTMELRYDDSVTRYELKV